jgi:hypothetical protein
MKVYVATAFPNREEAKAVMHALRAAGHVITHDWTGEAIDPAWPVERQEAYLRACGTADFEGVAEADALVLVNHQASRDAMAEFGMALGLGTPVFVLYPERRSSVFFHYAVPVGSVPELLEQLR